MCTELEPKGVRAGQRTQLARSQQCRKLSDGERRAEDKALNHGRAIIGDEAQVVHAFEAAEPAFKKPGVQIAAS